MLNIRFFNGFRYIRSRTVVRLQNYFFRQRLSVLLDGGGFVHMNAQIKPAQNDKPQVMHQHGGKESPCRHSCQMARRGQNKTAAPAAVFAEFSVVVLIRTHGIISKRKGTIHEPEGAVPVTGAL